MNGGKIYRKEDFARRVAFVAHGLMPDYLSTTLITERLQELGQEWPEANEAPGFIKWFSFPVFPLMNSGEPVWVDFYIIPVIATDFLNAIKDGRAYTWSEKVALFAIDEAEKDGVELTIGWGALTKMATDHGRLFAEKHTDILEKFHSTHGDAGTAMLTLQTMVNANLSHDSRVAIIGANGAIGDAITRALMELHPKSILLVGKADKAGEDKNLRRLEDLKNRALTLDSSGQVEVYTHQKKDLTKFKYPSDMVVVATSGMDLLPEEIPSGTLILDITTPSACHPDPGWHENRLVLTTGCGVFDQTVLPQGFGEIAGRRLNNVGAGGDRVIWGCTGETIARAVYGRKGHLLGQQIPIEELHWSKEYFPHLGFSPQLPLSFGRPLTWKEVRRFGKN